MSTLDWQHQRERRFLRDAIAVAAMFGMVMGWIVALGVMRP